jgi:hypothetical protein
MSLAFGKKRCFGVVFVSLFISKTGMYSGCYTPPTHLQGVLKYHGENQRNRDRLAGRGKGGRVANNNGRKHLLSKSFNPCHFC